jgi:hypothetical protein
MVMRWVYTPTICALALWLACVVSQADAAPSVSISQNAEAFPIVVEIRIVDGESPFRVRVTNEGDFVKSSSDVVITEQRVLQLPMHSNQPQVLTVMVTDATGQSFGDQRSVGRWVSQDEPFLLEAGRFGKDAAADAWQQVATPSSDTYCSSTPLSVENLGNGRAQARASWPGAYYLWAGPGGTLLNVVVKPSSGTGMAIRGMCQEYSPHPLGYSYVDEHLAQMRRDGVNAVQFIKVLKMKSPTDTKILPSPDLPYWDDLLESAIGRAKAAGFTVMLRLVYTLDAPWPQSDQLMSGLEPQNWDAWFSSFERIVLQYGALADRTGVDIYLFAESLFTTYPFESRYRHLITALRGVFSGALVVGSGPWQAGGLEAVSFWDALDYIGISGTLFCQGEVTYEQSLTLTTDELAAILDGVFTRDVLPTARRFEKPLLWTELYFNSMVGSTFSPNGIPSWPQTDPKHVTIPSHADQTEGYDATLRVLQKYRRYVAGAFCLSWPFFDPLEIESTSPSFYIGGTPVEQVFDTWWDDSPEEPAAPRSTSTLDTAMFEFTPWGRGTWTLSTSRVSLPVDEDIVNEGQPDEMRRIKVSFSNQVPGSLQLRYTLDGTQRARASAEYDGIGLAAQASPPARVQIKLDFLTADGQSATAISEPVELKPEARVITIPFENFSLPPDVQVGLGLGIHEISPAKVAAISVWPMEAAGTFIVWSWGIGACRRTGSPDQGAGDEPGRVTQPDVTASSSSPGSRVLPQKCLDLTGASLPSGWCELPNSQDMAVDGNSVYAGLASDGMGIWEYDLSTGAARVVRFGTKLGSPGATLAGIEKTGDELYLLVDEPTGQRLVICSRETLTVISEHKVPAEATVPDLVGLELFGGVICALDSSSATIVSLDLTQGSLRLVPLMELSPCAPPPESNTSGFRGFHFGIRDIYITTSATGQRRSTVYTLEYPIFILDDFHDRDFANALSGSWGTFTDAEWQAGRPWHFESIGQDVPLSLQTRHVAAEIVERFGKPCLAWTFGGGGWVQIRTWLDFPRDFDGSTREGVFLTLSTDTPIDLRVSVDFRVITEAPASEWEFASASCSIRVAAGEERRIALPFSDFILEVPTQATAIRTLQDVDRRMLETIGLIATPQDSQAAVFIHDVGFFGRGCH